MGLIPAVSGLNLRVKIKGALFILACLLPNKNTPTPTLPLEGGGRRGEGECHPRLDRGSIP